MGSKPTSFINFDCVFMIMKKFFIIMNKYTKVYMGENGDFNARSEVLAKRFEDTELRRNYVTRNFTTCEIITVNENIPRYSDRKEAILLISCNP